jgi:hypothetical protein
VLGKDKKKLAVGLWVPQSSQSNHRQWKEYSRVKNSWVLKDLVFLRALSFQKFLSFGLLSSATFTSY